MSDPTRRYPSGWEKFIPAALAVIGLVLLVLLGIAFVIALQAVHLG
ncbi:MAG TPA: hypothetical protein VIV15_11870 [Anaerolineales bacterium]